MRVSWRTWASVIIAVVAGGTAYHLYMEATAALPVVVATRDLAAPVKVERDMVTLRMHPAAGIHPQSVTSPEQVVGRVLRRSVVAGEPVLQSDVAPGEEAGLSLALPEGQQAFFLPTDLEQGLGGAVEPGDRVDVIFVGGQGPAGLSRTLLESVPVLQVRNEEGGPEARERPVGILLAVTPRQAEQLAYALTFGRIFLTLAPVAGGDHTTPGVTWESLFLPFEPGSSTVPSAAREGQQAPATAPEPPSTTPSETESPTTPSGGAGGPDPAPSGAGSVTDRVPLVNPDWLGGGPQP